MTKNRFQLAERISETTFKLMKGMTFKKFESAVAIGIRLSSIHLDTEYLVLDLEKKEQYLITKDADEHDAR